MTQPAEVTNRLDWADLVMAMHQVRGDVRTVQAFVTGLRRSDDTDIDPEIEKEFQVTTDRDLAREAEELEHERLLREDYEHDFDLDGDTDPGPEVEEP